MSRISHAAGLVVVLAGTLAGAQARADRIQDSDDVADYDDRQGAHTTGLWARIAHPDRGRYEARLQEGYALYAGNHAAQAIAPLVEAVGYEPSEPDGHYWLARAYAGARDFPECAHEYDVLHDLAPDYTSPQSLGSRDRPGVMRYEYAFCLAAGDRVEDAISVYRGVLDDKDVPAAERRLAWSNVGDAYEILGRLDEAILAYRHAIELAPGDALSRFALAVAYDRDEEPARAEQELDGALRIDGGYSVLGQPTLLYVPAEDEDYFHALIFQLAPRLEHAPARVCQGGPWLCRGLAIAGYRRFVDRAGDAGLWTARAKQHLQELGQPELAVDDLIVLGSDAARRTVPKLVVGAGPKLQRCVERRGVVLHVDVNVIGTAVKPAFGIGTAGKPSKRPAVPPPPPPPAGDPVTVRVTSVGAEQPTADELKCAAAQTLLLGLAPEAQAMELQFALIAI